MLIDKNFFFFFAKLSMKNMIFFLVGGKHDFQTIVYQVDLGSECCFYHCINRQAGQGGGGLMGEAVGRGPREREAPCGKWKGGRMLLSLQLDLCGIC